MVDLSRDTPEHCDGDTAEMCTPENCPDTGTTANNNYSPQTEKSTSNIGAGCPTMTRKFGSDNAFIVPAMKDIMTLPPVPFPTSRVYKMTGEEKIRELVVHHHNLLRISPVKHLFAHSDRKFAILVARTADFFVEIFGGPQYFTPEHGQPKLRHRHFPFTISEKDRIVWLERMEQALIETNFPIELHEEIWNWVEPLSIRMINRRTNMDAIERLPYNTRKRLLKVQ